MDVSSREDYRALFQDANDAILVIRVADGRILTVNTRASELYGWPHEELQGRPVWELARNPEAARLRFGDLCQRGYGRFEGEHRRADAADLSVEISASLCLWEGETAVVSVHRDVTDRVEAQRGLEESERRLRDLLTNVHMAAMVLDAAGHLQFCNPYLKGLAGADLVGTDWFDSCVPAPVRERARQGFLRNLREGTMPLHERAEVCTSDGELRTIAWNHTVLRDASGRATGCASIGADITDRVRAEEALRESEERYALAAQGSNDGLWDWDLRTDRVFFSVRWKEMLGFDERSVGDSPDEWFERVHPEDAPALRQDLEAHLAGHSPHFRSEFRMQHRDASWRWMLARAMAVRSESAAPHRIAGSLSDVHDRRTVEQQILHDALHDGLTGLPNRTLFLERVGQALLRSRRTGRAYAVLFLDLDRFKLVNDSLGHAMGDALIVEVAARLRAALAEGETLSRPGGDEFLVLLEEIPGLPEALACAERLRAALVRPLQVFGHDLHVSCSVGVAVGDPRHHTAEDVLREADTAAYRAKSQGRGSHVLFDPAMHARALALMQLESGLRRAIDTRSLAVAYQPIVSVESGRVEGFEALARWPRAGDAPVSPAEFIPVAEDTGLIVPLGRFVLGEALHQVKLWRERFPELGPLTVSVNLSARQIQMDDITRVVEEALEAAGLSGDALTLEITESVLADELRVPDTLRRLRDMQVRTSIDDFGTGYSSLSVLHRMPFDTLKIDKRFVDELSVPGDEHGAIVRTIVDLAHGLRMKVVAEGVETPAQLERLRAMRCTSAQGYLLSRPLSASDAERFLCSVTG